MKQFFKNIQTRLTGIWDVYNGPKGFEEGLGQFGVFLFFGVGVFAQAIMKIIALFVLYIVFHIAKAILLKLYPKIVILIGKIFGWSFVLILACFFLEIFIALIFNYWLGYHFESWVVDPLIEFMNKLILF
jgi:hypothetical protein